MATTRTEAGAAQHTRLEQEVASEAQWVVWGDPDGETDWVGDELAHDLAAVTRWVDHIV